ncbi:MAG: S8 family serine peptidase [Gaiellaceae bacterium]
MRRLIFTASEQGAGMRSIVRGTGARVRAAAAVVALAIAGTAVMATAAGGAGSGGADWSSKVDPGLLTRAATGQTEFFVHLRRQADVGGAYALRTKEQKGRFVYARLRATARETQGPLLAELTRLGVRHRAYWIVNAVWAVGDLSDVAAAASRPEVAHVYSVARGGIRTVAGRAGTASPRRAAAVEDNIVKTRAPMVWALGYKGAGVTVASADTGVLWTHPALKGKYRGWDGAVANHDYNWHDGAGTNADCPNVDTAPCDDNSHGTHTVGTMVGDDGVANQIGMAPDAKWIGCHNMNEGVGTPATYLDCMQWLMAPTKIDGSGPDPAKAPHVVNNSWGCPPSEGCPAPMLKTQLAASRAAGIFYSVSAGNEGPACDTVASPLGNYDIAFSVGATEDLADDEIVAAFSSRGPSVGDTAPDLKPNVVAPGTSVRSSILANGYGNKSGTSMAAPHVAGLVALIISAAPTLAGNVPVLESILQRTAVPLPMPAQPCGGDLPNERPNNTWGFGRIDALDAVQMALTGPTAVRVSSFAARRIPAGVSLAWRTSSEAGVLGFELRRSTANGRYVQVNRRLIPARGSAAGAAYRHVDGAAPARASSYRVDAVMAAGARRSLGTVRVPAR